MKLKKLICAVLAAALLLAPVAELAQTAFAEGLVTAFAAPAADLELEPIVTMMRRAIEYGRATNHGGCLLQDESGNLGAFGYKHNENDDSVFKITVYQNCEPEVAYIGTEKPSIIYSFSMRIVEFDELICKYGIDDDKHLVIKLDDEDPETTAEQPAGEKTPAATAEPDYKASGWALEGVRRAYGSGLMKGYDDEEFGAKDPYTIEQAIVTVYRMYELATAE